MQQQNIKLDGDPQMANSGEAKKFFKSLNNDLDVATPLQWSFLLDGAAEDQVELLMAKVSELGFTEVEPMADEEQEGCYTLWFAEVCKHTADSFAQRLTTVKQLATRERLLLSDYSAGTPSQD